MLMDIHEVLQFVDKVVYAKTGKRLNDLQRGIIEGTLKQQKYGSIPILKIDGQQVKSRE
jgi:hypothetical protein